MLMLGIMLNVNLTSCSKGDIVPDTEQGENNGEGEVVHPNGIPNDIPSNIIYYITNDDAIVSFEKRGCIRRCKDRVKHIFIYIPLL